MDQGSGKRRPGEEPHAVALALDDDSVAVMLDFVRQSSPAGTFVPVPVMARATLERLS